MCHAMFQDFFSSDSSDSLSSDRSCHFGGTCQILRENNSPWLYVSSQIKSPFLNRRQALKVFKLWIIFADPVW